MKSMVSRDEAVERWLDGVDTALAHLCFRVAELSALIDSGAEPGHVALAADDLVLATASLEAALDGRRPGAPADADAVVAVLHSTGIGDPRLARLRAGYNEVNEYRLAGLLSVQRRVLGILRPRTASHPAARGATPRDTDQALSAYRSAQNALEMINLDSLAPLAAS
jgi:hypothetical protein